MSNRRPRKEFAKRVKIQAWDRCLGQCEECTAKLTPGKFDYDHVVETVLGGKPTLENCRVLCKNCHRAKSSERAPTLAKSRRQEEKHLGMRGKEKKPLSKFKRKMDGTVVYRDTGEKV